MTAAGLGIGDRWPAGGQLTNGSARLLRVDVASIGRRSLLRPEPGVVVGRNEA